MAKASSFTRSFKAPNKVVRPSLLEVFPFQEVKTDTQPTQLIYTKTKEFTAVCPFSGLPDVADLEIVYQPSVSVLELKSLKEYILSYRDAGIYQEHATHRIHADLLRALVPTYLSVRTTYNVRGGFYTVATSGDEYLFERVRLQGITALVP